MNIENFGLELSNFDLTQAQDNNYIECSLPIENQEEKILPSYCIIEANNKEESLNYPIQNLNSIINEDNDFETLIVNKNYIDELPEYSLMHEYKEIKDLEYSYDSNGNLTTHGISFVAYYAGEDENSNPFWNYVVHPSENIEIQDAFLQMNVLGVQNDDFYTLLNEFNAKNYRAEQFKLADLAVFFEKQGYLVMSAK